MTTDTEAYADPAVARDELANEHRDRARAALPGDAVVALAEALLALEARIDELAVHVARLE